MRLKMVIVKAKKPNVLAFKYRQEKGDTYHKKHFNDDVECQWADFYFNIDKYSLSICSDCGDFGYSCKPTPDSETFLALMSRIGRDYLLSKISRKTVIDQDATWREIKAFINRLDEVTPDLEKFEVDCYCACYSSSNSYNEFIKSLNMALLHYNDGNYDVELYNCIVKTYPRSAKKIADIFADHIRPNIYKYRFSKSKE